MSSLCTSLHKLEQKHRTKTLVTFPEHISIDYDVTDTTSGKTQKSLEGFLSHDDELSPNEKKDKFAKMQSDINQIKLMLLSLRLQQTGADDVRIEDTGHWGVNDDIKHDNIPIEILDDGCKVTCTVCRTFMQMNQSRRFDVHA